MKASPIAAAAGFLALLFASTAAMADPVGEWRVADGTATVRIRHCGSDLCGFIAATVGTPGKDAKNPDPRKRNRSVIGLEILINMKRAGANLWNGATYDAEDGQLYSASIWQTDANTLNIKGCTPGSGVCGSQSWTRIK
jgi:uncharacterized protein (DUF2147 family)